MHPTLRSMLMVGLAAFALGIATYFVVSRTPDLAGVKQFLDRWLMLAIFPAWAFAAYLTWLMWRRRSTNRRTPTRG